METGFLVANPLSVGIPSVLFFLLFVGASLLPLAVAGLAGYFDAWGAHPPRTWAQEVAEWVSPSLTTVFLCLPALLWRLQCDWTRTPVSPEWQAAWFLVLFVAATGVLAVARLIRKRNGTEGVMDTIADIDFQLDGVPSDLAALVRTKKSLRTALIEMGAAGVRLVELKAGWSNPDLEIRKAQAFEVQVLGRPLTSDTTFGPFGKCFVQLGKGEWALMNAHSPGFETA